MARWGAPGLVVLLSTLAALAGARADGMRALWHGVGLTATLATLWWVLARTTSQRMLLGALVLAGIVTTPVAWAWPPPPVRVAAPMLNGERESDRLWSFAFQHAAQRIGRAQPVTGPLDGLEVRVRLEAPYRGPARLFAAVNGAEVGRLALPVDEQPDQVEAAAPVPSAALARVPAGQPAGALDLLLPVSVTMPGGGRLAHIVLWTDRPDSALRLVAQRARGGTSLGSQNSWFYASGRWYAGVVHAASGEVRPGLWHVFLARGHVGR